MRTGRLVAAFTVWAIVTVAMLMPPRTVRSIDDVGDATRPRRVVDVRNLRQGDIAEAHAFDSATVGTRVVRLQPPVTAIDIERGDIVRITGWAVDASAGRPSAAVAAISGKHFFVTDVDLPRADVAAALGSPAYAKSGFSLAIDSSSLPYGSLPFHFFGEDASGTRRYRLPQELVVTVRRERDHDMCAASSAIELTTPREKTSAKCKAPVPPRLDSAAGTVQR